MLNILPFGCRTVAVKPRPTYSKTNLDPHGLVGVNLGKAASVTSGYRVWVPSMGKVMVIGLPGQKSNICQEHAHTTNDIPTCSARAN